MAVVIAHKNSLAALGDINITINHAGELPSPEDLIGFISDALKTDPQALRCSIKLQADERSADEVLNTYFMIANSSASNPADRYDRFFVEVDDLRGLLRSAVKHFRDHDYLKAHGLFRQALQSTQAESLMKDLVYDFLVSGYVGYSLQSNIKEIRALIASVQTDYAAYIDRPTELSLAEAHQEIATRQASDGMLIENRQMLSRLLVKYGQDDVTCLNLEGLLYRRLGERKGSGDQRSAHLNRARSIYERIAALEPAMTVEHKNNWAITLVRLFELEQDSAALEKAEEVLSSVEYKATEVNLSDYLALPKTLNNMGNVCKQKMTIHKDAESYTAAIESYSRAERYWDEQRSPYEWAMLQKNKADVRCIYMKLFGIKKQTAQLAMSEIEASLKYRTADRAPYQYERSMAVKRDLEELLA